MAFSNSDGKDNIEEAAHQEARPSLSTLPPDLFSDNILSHLSRFPESLGGSDYDARGDVRENLSPYVSLSRVSRHLNGVVNSLGYLSFVKERYPSVFHGITRSPAYGDERTDWRSVARSAVGLELNWSDRSFAKDTEWSAENFAPREAASWGGRRQRRPARRPGQQTMGCTPVLDVADSDFAKDGEDTVVAGLGTEVAVMRSRDDGKGATRIFKEEGLETAGLDDVSGIHLVEADGDECTVLVARISGSLKLLRLSGKSDVEVLQEFAYGGEQQEITSSSRHDNIVLTTHENNRSHALRQYSVSIHSVPTDTVEAVPPSATASLSSHPWCSTFLSNTALAVGSKDGLDAFTVGEAALSPLFRRAITVPASDGEVYPMSVNSVHPISWRYTGSGSVVASGWQDGCARLYDVRASHDSAILTLKDPLRHGEPVYSILQTSPTSSQLLCGASSHSLVVMYDIRQPASPYDGNKARTYAQNSSAYVRHGDRTPRSGVYSLASGAGGGGRKVYAGLEGAVVSMRFAGEGVDGWRFDDYVGKSMYYHHASFRSELLHLGRSRRGE